MWPDEDDLCSGWTQDEDGVAGAPGVNQRDVDEGDSPLVLDDAACADRASEGDGGAVGKAPDAVGDCHRRAQLTCVDEPLSGDLQPEQQHAPHTDGTGSEPARKQAPEGKSAWLHGTREKTSPYIGVSLYRGLWRSYINANGFAKGLGLFEDAEEAARAYDRIASKLGRAINFPDEVPEGGYVLNEEEEEVVDPRRRPSAQNRHLRDRASLKKPQAPEPPSTRAQPAARLGRELRERAAIRPPPYMPPFHHGSHSAGPAPAAKRRRTERAEGDRAASAPRPRLSPVRRSAAGEGASDDGASSTDVEQEESEAEEEEEEEEEESSDEEPEAGAEAAAECKSKRPTSKFTGVSAANDDGSRWIARIASEHIGSYGSEEEAARAYDAEAVKLGGSYLQRLNFRLEHGLSGKAQERPRPKPTHANGGGQPIPPAQASHVPAPEAASTPAATAGRGPRVHSAGPRAQPSSAARPTATPSPPQGRYPSSTPSPSGDTPTFPGSAQAASTSSAEHADLMRLFVSGLKHARELHAEGHVESEFVASTAQYLLGALRQASGQ